MLQGSAVGGFSAAAGGAPTREVDQLCPYTDHSAGG